MSLLDQLYSQYIQIAEIQTVSESRFVSLYNFHGFIRFKIALEMMQDNPNAGLESILHQLDLHNL
jgi:hypothetical protein